MSQKNSLGHVITSLTSRFMLPARVGIFLFTKNVYFQACAYVKFKCRKNISVIAFNICIKSLMLTRYS